MSNASTVLNLSTYTTAGCGRVLATLTNRMQAHQEAALLLMHLRKGITQMPVTGGKLLINIHVFSCNYVYSSIRDCDARKCKLCN